MLQQSVLDAFGHYFGPFPNEDKWPEGSHCLNAYIFSQPQSWKSYDRPLSGSSPLDSQMFRNLSLAVCPLADVAFGWKSGAIHLLPNLLGHLSCMKNDVFETLKRCLHLSGKQISQWSKCENMFFYTPNFSRLSWLHLVILCCGSVVSTYVEIVLGPFSKRTSGPYPSSPDGLIFESEK